MLDVLTYAASKKYTDEALAGGGAQQGKSAYEIAVEKGFKGTEEEWLVSLEGDQGPVGPDNVYVGEQTPPPTGAKVKIDPNGRKIMIPTKADDLKAISYDPQKLILEQQEQARSNISALTSKGLTGAKVGDLMQITAVDEKGIPTALKPTTLEELEGKWELIETHEMQTDAVFERNKTPEGVPYDFKGVIIAVHDPGLSANVNFSFRDKNGMPVCDFNYDAKSSEYFRMDAFKIYNLWMCYRLVGVDRWAYSDPRYNSDERTLHTDLNCTKIYSNKPVPSGTTIKIWAVRA